MQTDTEFGIAAGRVRTILLARWVGTVFALVQVLSYRQLPYPDGIRTFALVVVAAMAVSNLGFELARRRAGDQAAVRRLGLVILVTDVLLISGLTWVYAFDDVSAIFAILFLVPIEGAVLFGLAGAMWTWGGVGVLYLGREVFSLQFGQVFEPESISFRVGLIGIVALVVGLLVRDLVEQRRQTLAALEEARRVEDSRSRLISMLAHDVRAPIAATRAALDTLEAAGDRLEPERRSDVLRAGRRQADRALLLARDLLDLARVEAGTLQVDAVDVDLADLVARVVTVLPGQVELRTDLAGARVLADPQRLEQVLFNLLDNAVKYGAGPIEVAAVPDGDAVAVRVRDHGPGVADGLELFAAFARAGEGSVGLGLWIVRQLVDAMDGTVHHEPAAPGACFVVRLPVATAAGVDARGDADGVAAPGQPRRTRSSSSDSGTTSPVSRS